MRHYRLPGCAGLALLVACAAPVSTTDVAVVPAATDVPVAAAAQTQPQQGWIIEHDEGALITTLGRDTVAVEQFMVHGPTLQTTAVTRSPRTSSRAINMAWNEAGTVQSFTVQMGDQTRTMQLPGQPVHVPFTPGIYSPYVVLARIAAANNLSNVQMGEIPLTVTRPEPGWISFNNPELGTIRVRLDDQLRAQEIDASGSTLGGHVVRVPSLDISAEAARFSALDAAGRGLGPLSVPDTVRARVGGANIVIDYHRPSMRGRQIFGGPVVPFGRVWRTGANQATGFTTDRDLLIGETRVPAGSYTVWSLPTADGWQLILNKQTGQWGTQYNPAQDLAHIPLRVERLTTPLEQFTIAVNPDGTLSVAWADRRGTVPIRVAP